MIPKPDKDHTNPSNHRPISLLSHLGKLYERIITVIITNVSSTLQVIPPHQFGFRATYDTQMQLLRIIDAITVGYNEKHHTLASFLDVQGAFDKVWHDGLLAKLHLLKFPINIITLLQNFLAERTFQILEGKSLSEKKRISAGVPQGSPLSPILYNIFTADLVHRPGVQIATFADDTMLYTSQRNLQIGILQLQRALQELYAWTQRWKITVNTNKSTIIIFTRRLLPNIPRFRFGPHLLNFNDSVKYLGVILDKRLTFRQHIKRKCNQRISLLYPLLHSPILPLRTRIILYNSLIRSAMTYAGSVYHHAAKCHLQIIQNRCIRIITGHERSTRISQLHDDTGLPTIAEFMRKSKQKLWDKIRRFDNPLVQNIGAIQPRRRIFRLPRIT